MAAALVLTALRHWLIRQQQAFIADFAAGSLKNWVLCVGNEAGGESSMSTLSVTRERERERDRLT
jgi:hypothetical protein